MEILGAGIFALVVILFAFLGLALLIDLVSSLLRHRLVRNPAEQQNSRLAPAVLWSVFGVVAIVIAACAALQAIFGAMFTWL